MLPPLSRQAAATDAASLHCSETIDPPPPKFTRSIEYATQSQQFRALSVPEQAHALAACALTGHNRVAFASQQPTTSLDGQTDKRGKPRHLAHPEDHQECTREEDVAWYTRTSQYSGYDLSNVSPRFLPAVLRLGWYRAEVKALLWIAEHAQEPADLWDPSDPRCYPPERHLGLLNPSIRPRGVTLRPQPPIRQLPSPIPPTTDPALVGEAEFWLTLNFDELQKDGAVHLGAKRRSVYNACVLARLPPKQLPPISTPIEPKEPYAGWCDSPHLPAALPPVAAAPGDLHQSQLFELCPWLDPCNPLAQQLRKTWTVPPAARLTSTPEPLPGLPYQEDTRPGKAHTHLRDARNHLALAELHCNSQRLNECWEELDQAEDDIRDARRLLRQPPPVTRDAIYAAHRFAGPTIKPCSASAPRAPPGPQPPQPQSAPALPASPGFALQQQQPPPAPELVVQRPPPPQQQPIPPAAWPGQQSAAFGVARQPVVFDLRDPQQPLTLRPPASARLSGFPPTAARPPISTRLSGRPLFDSAADLSWWCGCLDSDSKHPPAVCPPDKPSKHRERGGRRHHRTRKHLHAPGAPRAPHTRSAAPPDKRAYTPDQAQPDQTAASQTQPLKRPCLRSTVVVAPVPLALSSPPARSSTASPAGTAPAAAVSSRRIAVPSSSSPVAHSAASSSSPAAPAAARNSPPAACADAATPWSDPLVDFECDEDLNTV